MAQSASPYQSSSVANVTAGYADANPPYATSLMLISPVSIFGEEAKPL
jgi:hypothetical protein